MNHHVSNIVEHQQPRDWKTTARELAIDFGKRAGEYDRSGSFVSENFSDLRKAGFFSAGIPAEIGGGGATFSDITNIIREIGKQCGSTALTFAMHSHTVGANVYKHLRGDESATRTLKKIAAKELIISTTGANDWLQSSGVAERVDGGFKINARKHFVSGCPAADVLATSATFDGDDGTEVLHFAIPRASEGISIIDTWDTLGMRGTGAAYVGLAESATHMAVESAKRKGADLAGVAGELKNALVVAELALDDMVRKNDNHGFNPCVKLVSDILTRKAIVAEKVKETVEIAAELVGGPGFYRGHAMERIVRDIRALHYHPLPLRRQQIFSGRLALGLEAIDYG
jgi:acyl-CoA dehydrogenase